MDKLSASMQAIITARPLDTILRGETPQLERDYARVTKTKPTRFLDVPDSFDGREVWKGCITPVFDQGKCGSCWD